MSVGRRDDPRRWPTGCGRAPPPPPPCERQRLAQQRIRSDGLAQDPGVVAQLADLRRCFVHQAEMAFGRAHSERAEQRVRRPSVASPLAARATTGRGRGRERGGGGQRCHVPAPRGGRWRRGPGGPRGRSLPPPGRRPTPTRALTPLGRSQTVTTDRPDGVLHGDEGGVDELELLSTDGGVGVESASRSTRLARRGPRPRGAPPAPTRRRRAVR